MTQSNSNRNTNNPKIQYKILWDYIDEKKLVHKDNELVFLDRDEANNIWVNLRKNPNVANLRHETIKTQDNQDKEYFAVDVKYYNYYKIYTFLSHNEVKSDYVVVGTNDILQVVKVVRSYKVRKSILIQKMPFDKYAYIVGTVETERRC